MAAAIRCLELDPASDYDTIFRPLVEYHLELSPDDEDEKLEIRLRVCTLVATRLDYFFDREVRTWQLLASSIHELRKDFPKGDAPIWYDRKEWWSRSHFQAPKKELYERGFTLLFQFFFFFFFMSMFMIFFFRPPTSTEARYLHRVICVLLLGWTCDLLRFVALHDAEIVLEGAFEEFGITQPLLEQDPQPAIPAAVRKKKAQKDRQ